MVEEPNEKFERLHGSHGAGRITEINVAETAEEIRKALRGSSLNGA